MGFDVSGIYESEPGNYEEMNTANIHKTYKN